MKRLDMTDEERVEELEVLFRLEDYYHEFEMPKIKKNIAEFKAEMGIWGKCRRLVYLYDRLIELDLELIDRRKRYQQSADQDHPYMERALIASYIPDVEREIRNIEREIQFIVKGAQEQGQGITPEVIERAKQYPIEDLIEVRRGMALCPFHDDHHPSMGIKNNRFRCFACGAKGDSIEFLMRRDGMSFQEAVKALAGRVMMRRAVATA